MVMRKILNKPGQFLPGLVILLLILGCQDVPPNNPPEITDIISYPAAPKAGQEVTLSAIVSDEDGDVIRYQWMANGGTFLDSLGSNPIRWTAPRDSGVVTLIVTASDLEASVTYSSQLQLLPGVGSVAGHVKDASNNYFLEDIVVNLNGTEMTTNSDGYFHFSNVPSGNNIPLSAMGENYITYAQLIDVDVDENIINISMNLLTEVGRIAGYVSDSVTGLHLEGALVQSGTISATSGEDGYYELYNVPISVNVPVRASLNGYFINSSLMNVVAGYNAHDFALVPSLATVTGRVTASLDGGFLAGAIVTLNDYVDTTNSAGYFEMENVQVTSNASISASLEGYYTSYLITDIIGGTNYVELELGQNSGSLSGWIRSDLNGNVIPNATIRVGSQEVLSGLDGSYQLGELGIGRQLVTCSANNFTLLTTTLDIEPGNNNLDFDLVPSVGAISGYLQDALTDSALRSRVVTLGAAETTTDNFGFYEFEDVAIGQHFLEVDLADYQRYGQTVTIVPGQLDHNIQLLLATGTVQGIIRVAGGNAVVAQAIVSIGEIRDTTGTNGYYELNLVPLGNQELSCRASLYYDVVEVIEVGVGGNIHDLSLSTSVGDISGLVRDGSTNLGLDSAIVTIGDSSYFTNATGDFDLMDFPQGNYEITVNKSGYYGYSGFHDIIAGNNVIVIGLNASVGDISGLVRDSATNLGLDSAVVSIGGSSYLTSDDGEFTLLDVPLGSYEILINKAGYQEYAEIHAIAAGSNMITVDLNRSTGQVRGYIRDAATSVLLDSVQVFLENDTTMTDSNGYYLFEEIPVRTNASLRALRTGYNQYADLVDIQGGDNVIGILLTSSE